MSRLRYFLILCVLILQQAPLQAAEIYKVDATKSKIEFRLRHLLGSVKGRFNEFSATMKVDREHPENSSVKATLVTHSVDTANRTRDAHLCSELFECAKYPEITFESRSVKPTGADTADVVGDLTMHGVTRPILLKVVFAGPKSPADPPVTHWQVTTNSVKRSDFALRWSSGVEAVSMIGNDVAVTIAAEARRQP